MLKRSSRLVRKAPNFTINHEWFMLWRSCVAFSVLLSFLLVTAPLRAEGARQTIRITTGHWPPYLDQSRPGEGFLAQIIREAFANEDIIAEFTFFPWSRALALVKASEYEASAVWSCTPKRRMEYVYSAPILPYEYVFYHRRATRFDWHQLSDLEGMVIGLTQDYSYGQTLSDAIESGQISADVTTSDLANFRRLLLDRIDLFPMDAVVGEAMIEEQLGPEARSRLMFHPRPLRSALYHLLFSKDDPDAGRLKRAFNRGLAQLRESGRYQAIIEQALKAHSSEEAAAILEDKLVNWDQDLEPCA